MHASTPFQFLPPHVVQLTTDYVVGSSDGTKELLRPLLHVCHNFRAITLPLYFHHFKLMISNSPVRRVLAATLKTDRIERKGRESTYLGHPTHHLARELEIELDEVDVYSGTALKMLSRGLYDGCAFPLVRRITFTIILGDNNRTEQPVVAANISAFVQRIKQMAPMAKALLLDPDSPSTIDHSTGDHFDDLATQLFQLVGQIELGPFSAHSDLRELQLDIVRDLVCIKHTTGHSIDMFHQLARRSAPTLESLEIFTSETRGFATLIQDADGAYVSYLCLTALCLDGNLVDPSVLPPIFKNAIPFPCLRRLEILSECSFGDDTFFRGNAATLEYLHMPLSGSTVIMLRKHSVFTPQSHPRLRHASIISDDNVVPGVLATNAEALKFVLGIGHRAPVRLTNLPVTGAELIEATSSLNNHASIRVLSLNWTTLDLWEVIALIRSLPLLSDLSTEPPNIGTLPDGIALNDIPAYVISTFAPMGTKFKRWLLVDYHTKMGDDSLMCVLLLALACPSFWRADTLAIRYEESLRILKEALSLDMFKPYTQHLQYFQFHGRDN
ncbi:hypothetical protein H4R27_004986 [Coemansia aciculifera]|nr:hypothetical protein H4R27_004986 [Coemansia aciculifera]